MQLYQKLTPAQIFSSEFSKIFKSIYFVEHLRTIASDIVKQLKANKLYCNYFQFNVFLKTIFLIFFLSR